MDFGTHHRRRTIADINLTPLIDIVFNLLIFFLITTTFVQNPGIEVDLPKASAATTQREVEPVVVAVTAEGDIVLGGRPVDVPGLLEALQERRRKEGKRLLIVQADKRTPHGRVVEVMDVAQRAGFDNLAIATEAE